MLISLNELKKLVDIKIPDDELFSLIGSRLVEIESVDDWTKKFHKIYVVKVLSCEDIEGTHLHLCKIDAGQDLNSEIDPEHSDYIQVVCGAPNVKTGMFAAWIAPGAVVPATAGTSESFEISARKLRGYMSYGMLAGADELGLGDDHSGIVELDPTSLKPGALLSDALDLNDKIIEVENKSLTHRPDCFGIYGFAREVAGILGQEFKEPLASIGEPLKDFLSSHSSTAPDFSINLLDRSICPAYEALVFDFSTLPARKTPYLTPDDIFLFKSGMRPISPLVDATNLIMLKTGQPLHAFDYDKFLAVGSKTSAPEISVRLARNGEKLTLLDGQEITLERTDIVICSGDTPVALAGAMGGKSTEIDASTKKIIVEIASFSLYNLRKTQMSHGIFSEAITRFTKGRPATDLAPATDLSIQSFAALGGKFSGAVFEDAPEPLENSPIRVSIPEINSLLGSNYSKDLIIKTLKNVNIRVESSSENTLEVFPPVWRTDLHIKEDVIEEVGRLLGYDNLPLSFPTRPLTCAKIDPLLSLKSRVRSILSDRLGFNELLTYSFVSRKLLEKADSSPEDAYEIVNSISPELELFRPSLVPTLVEKTYENFRAGHKDFTLYEINQVSKKSFGLNEENVPNLKTCLSVVSLRDFYFIKSVILELKKSLGLDLVLKSAPRSAFENSPFEPLRSLEIYLTSSSDEILLGCLGELKSSVKKSFKLSEVCSALEISLEPLILVKNPKSSAPLKISLSKFPFVSRDLTFRVSEDTPFAAVESALISALSEDKDLVFNLTPTSIYKKPVSSTKNLSFHLDLTNKTKTLNSAEISAIIEDITARLSALGAELV